MTIYTINNLIPLIYLFNIILTMADIKEKPVTKCTSIDCGEETWNIVNGEVAYCCGHTQGSIIAPILIVIILIYMAYTYYSSGQIEVISVIFLIGAIASYFILPDLMGTSMRGKWNIYNERVKHLMKIIPGTRVVDAKAIIEREELAERTRRTIQSPHYYRHPYRKPSFTVDI